MSDALKFENDPRNRPQAEIPDNLDDAIRVLEDHMFADLVSVEQSTPDPLAPLSLKIAHSIAVARVRADSEVLSILHEQKQQTKEQ
ncbi:MAG: hypothetical protein ACR2FM_05730 [Candidatus Saccharimonadales bacterium]